MKKTIVVIFFLFLITPIVFAERPHYIYDNANVVNSDWETKINEFGLKVDTNSTVEIVCITIQKLDGITIDEARVKYFQDIPLDGVKGIGKSGKDNGVLIILAMEDREWGIEVGYGLEGLLTDSKVGNIGRTDIVPNMKNGNTGKALYDAMLSIASVVGFSEPKPEVVIQPVDYSFINTFLLVVVGLFGGATIITIYMKHLDDVKYVAELEKRRIENEKRREKEEKEYQERIKEQIRLDEERRKTNFFCPHCNKMTMGRKEDDKRSEFTENGFIWLLITGFILCLTCKNTINMGEQKSLVESVKDRQLRKMWEQAEREAEQKREAEEEERRPKRRREEEYSRRNDDSHYRSSSSSSSSGGSFGGGHSGGGGASGKW
jgi:uncharacterized membrane protein YgcG